MYAEYASYFQKLNDYLKWQTERIRYLESRIDGLEQELDKVKSQDRIRIDKIEYNFDQLKVEKLDGTLNVGIAPAGLGAQNIDDLAVGGKTVYTNTARSESFERIQKRVDDFLLQAAPAEMEKLQDRYQLHLSEEFQDFMIGDLQGQTGQRIEYYMQSIGGNGQTLLLTQEQEEAIASKVIDDVRSGLEQYLMKQKDEGGKSDDSNEFAGGK
ncbi:MULTISPECIES: spore germination protein GerPC [Paenibacillus]|uniref:spore germination protein GerPC n=1 Tax=Paenibacillus TaxID=44249 RepID=UPI00191654E9|nr:spore germination protein GerPC [Paenibacillus sp. EPM92]